MMEEIVITLLFYIKSRKASIGNVIAYGRNRSPKNNYEALNFEVLESKESIHNDEFFGESKIFRDKILIKLNKSIGLDLNNILIKYQGCADVGICYPIQIHKLL